MKSKNLLISQLVLIALLFYFANFTLIFENLFLSILFALSVGLGLYSAYNMGLDTYTPFPEPQKGSRHVQEGVYKYMRHPMYTSLIVLGLMLVLTRPEFLNTIIYILLLYILDTKASFEEILLLKLHPTYKKYMETTKKFLPFIY